MKWILVILVIAVDAPYAVGIRADMDTREMCKAAAGDYVDAITASGEYRVIHVACKRAGAPRQPDRGRP